MAIDFEHPFESISNPRKTTEGLIVFDVMQDGASGIFVASPHDRYAPYGPLLFAAALRGEFGGVKIAPLEGEI
jgi:hypothetical protein